MLSGYIKSTIVMLLVVTSSAMAQENGMHRVPKITFFLTLNQANPINNFSKDAHVIYPHDMLSATSELPSGFSTGFSLFFFKKIGFDFAISTYNFKTDSIKNLSAIKDLFPANEAGIFFQGNLKVITLSTGLSYRMEYKGFAIQPKFLVGLGFTSEPEYFDIYLSRNNTPTQTIEYQGKTCTSVVFTPSMNFSYAFRLSGHVSMGFQLTCDYVYSRPEFRYSVRSYDYPGKTILYNDEKSVSSPFECWSIQAGIFFRIIHPD